MMDTLFDFDLLRRGGVPRTRICDCDGLRLDVLAAPPAGGRLAVKDSLFVIRLSRGSATVKVTRMGSRATAEKFRKGTC